MIEHQRKEKLAKYDKYFKSFEYSRALDAALDVSVDREIDKLITSLIDHRISQSVPLDGTCISYSADSDV